MLFYFVYFLVYRPRYRHNQKIFIVAWITYIYVWQRFERYFSHHQAKWIDCIECICRYLIRCQCNLTINVTNPGLMFFLVFFYASTINRNNFRQTKKLQLKDKFSVYLNKGIKCLTVVQFCLDLKLRQLSSVSKSSLVQIPFYPRCFK